MSLLNSISEFSNSNKDAKLEQYLEDVSLVSDIDLYEESLPMSVTLLTVHSAKGLSFLLYLSPVAKKIFSRLSNRFNPDATVEEERRLFYVAITRANRKYIFLMPGQDTVSVKLLIKADQDLLMN